LDNPRAADATGEGWVSREDERYLISRIEALDRQTIASRQWIDEAPHAFAQARERAVDADGDGIENRYDRDDDNDGVSDDSDRSQYGE
jgi:hypothetical protein